MGDAENRHLSADGHWVVVDGRRWRATDPELLEPFHKEMVDELMAARRDVRRALRADGDADERAARRRVHLAKVALGERGEAWWEPSTGSGARDRLVAVVLTLAGHRGPDRTLCPSDAARALGERGWRSRMGPVRDVARQLARNGEIEVVQRGTVLDPDQPWRGPIRIRNRSV